MIILSVITLSVMIFYHRVICNYIVCNYIICNYIICDYTPTGCLGARIISLHELCATAVWRLLWQPGATPYRGLFFKACERVPSAIPAGRVVQLLLSLAQIVPYAVLNSTYMDTVISTLQVCTYALHRWCNMHDPAATWPGMRSSLNQ